MTPRRTAGVSGTALAIALAGATQAWAAWAVTGDGAGAGKAGVLTGPTSVSAPSTSTGSVALSWSGATAPTGTTLSYLVERLAGGTPTAVCGSSFASPISGTSCTDSGVSTGSYTYRVTARTGTAWKAVGASSSAVVVTAASLFVGTPDLVASSDAGSSDTDNVTNVTTPTFTGNATTGATVTLYSGSTVIGSTTAVAGTWTITSATLASGSGTTHTITASASLAGSTVTSAALTVTIDNTAPTGSVAFANPTVDTNKQGATISGTLSGDVVRVALSITCASGTPSIAAATYPTATTFTSRASGLTNNVACTVTAVPSDTAGNTKTPGTTQTFTP